VISLGGGAWIKPENRKLLADLGVFTVWLDAPFELCWHRIEPGDQVRPLAPNRKAAINLYAARRPFYALAMMHVKVTENSTAKAIAADIADAVLQQRANT
jgi:shikimate kinase